MARTTEQALKDAQDAYNAWCEGKPIEWRPRDGLGWISYSIGDAPDFCSVRVHWRPAQEQPPELSLIHI